MRHRADVAVMVVRLGVFVLREIAKPSALRAVQWALALDEKQRPASVAIWGIGAFVVSGTWLIRHNIRPASETNP